MPHVRSTHRLDSDRSALLVIDVQQKLCPAIRSSDNVIRQIVKLAEAAQVLDVPAAATVQYPDGLGELVDDLQPWFPSPQAKRAFTAAGCRDELDQWVDQGRDQIVVTGIESHICVLQTVLDLIAEGLRPYVVAEAVASRHGGDHENAMTRMRDAGAVITTVESVLFEWLNTSDRPEFKPISRLIK